MVENLLHDPVVECLASWVEGGFALLSFMKQKEPWGYEMVFRERPAE